MKKESELSDFEKRFLIELCRSVMQGRWSKEGLVHLIDFCGEVTNLTTVTEFCRRQGKTYNGVKKMRGVEIIELFNKKFVIDGRR